MFKFCRYFDCSSASCWSAFLFQLWRKIFQFRFSFAFRTSTPLVPDKFVHFITSVRLSVTFVHSIQTAGDIVKPLCRPGSPIILVLWLAIRAPISNSKGNPSSGGAKYKGWENLAIFDWNRRLSRKRYEIGPWLLWNVNRKSYALYRMVIFSTTLTAPNPVFKVMAFWSRISQ